MSGYIAKGSIEESLKKFNKSIEQINNNFNNITHAKEDTITTIVKDKEDNIKEDNIITIVKDNTNNMDNTTTTETDIFSEYDKEKVTSEAFDIEIKLAKEKANAMKNKEDRENELKIISRHKYPEGHCYTDKKLEYSIIGRYNDGDYRLVYCNLRERIFDGNEQMKKSYKLFSMPSKSTIAFETKIYKRKVDKIISDLQRDKYLVIVKSETNSGSNHYYFPLEDFSHTETGELKREVKNAIIKQAEQMK